jgi:hypothetical protein
MRVGKGEHLLLETIEAFQRLLNRRSAVLLNPSSALQCLLRDAVDLVQEFTDFDFQPFTTFLHPVENIILDS